MQIELKITLSPEAEAVISQLAAAISNLGNLSLNLSGEGAQTAKAVKGKGKAVKVDPADVLQDNPSIVGSEEVKTDDAPLVAETLKKINECKDLKELAEFYKGRQGLIESTPELRERCAARKDEFTPAQAATLTGIINGAMDKGHLESIYKNNQEAIDKTPDLGEALKAKAASFTTAKTDIFGEVVSEEEKPVTIESIRALFTDEKYKLYDRVDLQVPILEKLRELKVPDGPDQRPTIAMLSKCDNAARKAFYDYLLAEATK